MKPHPVKSPRLLSTDASDLHFDNAIPSTRPLPPFYAHPRTWPPCARLPPQYTPSPACLTHLSPRLLLFCRKVLVMLVHRVLRLTLRLMLPCVLRRVPRLVLRMYPLPPPLPFHRYFLHRPLLHHNHVFHHLATPIKIPPIPPHPTSPSPFYFFYFYIPINLHIVSLSNAAIPLVYRGFGSSNCGNPARWSAGGLCGVDGAGR